MKKTLFILFIIFANLASYSFPAVPEYALDSLEIINYPIYEIDTIRELDGLTFVADKDNYWFAIPNKLFESNKSTNNPITTTEILTKEGVMLLDPDYSGLLCCIRNNDFILKNVVFTDYPLGVRDVKYKKLKGAWKNFHLFTFKKPDFFLLVLIQGKAFNDLEFRTQFDLHEQPLTFPDPYAYYKMLCPGWIEKMVDE